MTVYIAPRKGTDSYHTDRDCWSLNQANRIKEVEKGDVEDLTECTFCTGEFERIENPREGLRAKIERGEIDTDQ